LAPLKVLVTCTFAEPYGGCERNLLTFLEKLDRELIEPVVVFHMRGSLVQKLGELGVRAEVVETGRLRQLHRGAAAVARTRQIIARERPDLILSWFTRAHLYTAPAAILAGRRERLAWIQHGMPGGTNLDAPATLMPATAVGLVSEAAARAQARKRPRRRTFVMTPGIDPPDPAPANELAELRASLGIAEARVVGLVGRLQHLKGQHHLIEAIGRLRSAGHEVHGLVVGGDAYATEPDYEPFLRRRASELGLGRAVTFAGQVADALPYIQLMDVIVSASEHEAFGMTLVEAMALSVPVVAFDNGGGPSEIVEDERSGLLARPGDVSHLADQVARVLRDEPLRDRLVAGGRRRYEAEFTAERMVRALERELTRLAR
jgi:glycosyltransferase involved in cell wall biosynthesis